MPTPKADLILHPVRMRVILALAGRQMTARQLAVTLADVAPATLYRHLNAMAAGGVLTVVERNPVRGTVEKVYALAGPGAAHLSATDIAGMTKDDYMQLFTGFVVTLLGDFARYLNREAELDLAADGVGFQKYPMYLSDAEFREFAQRLSELILPYLTNDPSPERQRRLISLILLPDDDLPP